MATRRKPTSETPSPTPASEPLPPDEAPVVPEETKRPTSAVVQPWPEFLQGAGDAEVRERYSSEVAAIAGEHRDLLERYSVLLLLQPEDSISAFSLDQIYTALSASPARERDILLVLLSRGGIIEPAYQISKLCKAYAREHFVVAVPREAKSAATLIALGADEIHIGPLGQLGPIDPQLGGHPALGVTQALQTIAALSQKHPGSAEMFARYLRMALTVEQIGYCDRVSESAVQYAERLLSNKPSIASHASQISKELVYEYKDHGFVIDFDEAQKHLGDGWVKTNTAELKLAEQLYRHFDWVNLFFGFHQSKRMMALGNVSKPVAIILEKKAA